MLLLHAQGCGKVYAQLEECLGDNSRDWRACQAGAGLCHAKSYSMLPAHDRLAVCAHAEVKALKHCYSKFNNANQEQQPSNQ